MSRLARLAFPAAILAGLLAACSGTGSDAANSMPMAPSGPPNILVSCAVAQDSIDAILPQIFTPGSARGTSVSTDNQMNKALRKDNFPLALQYMNQLIDLTLKSYYANPSQITGGRTAQATQRVQDLISGLYCVNGLGLINPTIDPNGTAAIVVPSQGGTVAIPDPTTPGKNKAASAIQPNDVPGNTPVIVTISPTTQHLDTPLDQYGPFYEFHVTPAVTFANPVLTGACINTVGVSPTVLGRLALAHDHDPNLPVSPGNNQFGNIEILAPASLGNLNLSCDPLPSQLTFMDRVRNRVESFLMPDNLYAAAATGTGGAGGKVTNYSPYGAVDPLLSLSANAASTTGTAGSAVASPPSVTITTDSGKTVPGVNVGFAVTAGTGSIAPASASTGATGVASTTSWILGTGSNTVTATPSQGGLSFTPASVAFSATGGAAIGAFDYTATGWSYLQLTTFPTIPSATAIAAAVGSSAGYAGPIQTAAGVSGCSYDATLHSSVFPVNSVVAFRRDFVLPGGATSGTLSLAVDNDFKVFINGDDRTADVVAQHGNSTGVYASGAEAGFMNHDNCAAQGDFTLALSGLSTVSNTVVVIALDRGGVSYIDASVVTP